MFEVEVELKLSRAEATRKLSDRGWEKLLQLGNWRKRGRQSSKQSKRSNNCTRSNPCHHTFHNMTVALLLPGSWQLLGFLAFDIRLLQKTTAH